MFVKLFGGKDRATGSPKRDRAIIHQSVPDEVLYPDGKPDPAGKDMSWLDGGAPPNAGSPPTAAASPKTAPPPKAKPAPAPAPAPKAAGPSPVADMPANAPIAASEDRPPFPYGWLVVVEGPGTGAWFPLFRGRSDIGGADGQTVRLGFGDGAVASQSHATLTYDEDQHTFRLDGEGQLRVNGAGHRAGMTLRDGDVFTLGGTSLRLVALCSQNFHWSEHIAAE
ncbi:MAG: FHA domain-containing protein [Silicimonas sp.]|nr:FHA domain-containing protein [Silicimonas sp.]